MDKGTARTQQRATSEPDDNARVGAISDEMGGFRAAQVIRNIGARGIVASLLVFLLTVAATCAGGIQLYRTTKEGIELKGRLNAVSSAKEFDAYLIVRKNTVMLAGHVVDGMVADDRSTEDIVAYLSAESESIKRSIDQDYTGLYGWIAGEYCDGVGSGSPTTTTSRRSAPGTQRS